MANPYGVTFEDLSARCPNCANAMESEDAVVCLHCGYNTRSRQQTRTRKVRDVTGGDTFLWLLPGIACALGAVTLSTIVLVYCLMIGDWVGEEDEWWRNLLKHYGIKIWLAVLCLYIDWILGKFAVKRLIYHYNPPEIEEKMTK